MTDPLSILIVDDEPRSRNGVKRTLNTQMSEPVSIHLSANPDEAIRLIRSTHVDIVITDIRMPGMSGLELIDSLQDHSGELLFIVISAYSEFDYAQRALELGVIQYLLKPVQRQKLIEAVNKATKRLSHHKETTVTHEIDETLPEFHENQASYSEPVLSALYFIDEHLSEKIGMKDIAGHVHLNPNYLSVHFKEQVGLTFSDYLTRKRLQYAKYLLLTTRNTVAEIAEQSGYQTAKYFVKIFKNHVNMTPTEYRKASKSQ
ncbi:response regulator transcription factor [Salisediminibacterium beveridgei]|uniref:Two-component response regulator yesN n=1 Tax=Salisediminibacterium beveridgei TaxID=632773 RepID=A0A1D7QXL8_9BACI|nr:response regulator [Salisediminibacterium beveridgei]AOM83749.1 Two-component response regulator yesN [Salisediminibacterium beveridgei]